jgi:putative endonuclease
LRLAFGEPQGSLMGPPQGESNALSEPRRGESKGYTISGSPSANRKVRSGLRRKVSECPERAPTGRVEGLLPADDDGIVVVVYFVYILRCAGDALYIGETADLERRLERHLEGTACAFTARRRPVTLAYSESYATRAAAVRRERQLKRWTRAKKEALMAGDHALLRRS